MITALFRLTLLLLAFCCSQLQAAPLPTQSELEATARQHYETRGEWAGKFVIRKFLRHRLETVNENAFIAHLEYQWASSQMPDQTGLDERTFEFHHQNGRWQVVKMGGNHSGKP